MITREHVIEALKTCLDPELGIDVWTLGLIYKIDLEKQNVMITMTFTSPMCPYGPLLVEQIKNALKGAGAHDAKMEITFDPPWQPSEEVKELLGMTG